MIIKIATLRAFSFPASLLVGTKNYELLYQIFFFLSLLLTDTFQLLRIEQFIFMRIIFFFFLEKECIFHNFPLFLSAPDASDL